MTTIGRYRDHEEFKRLVGLRLRMAFGLSAVMSGLFGIYLFLLTGGKHVAALKLFDSELNVGLVVALVIVVAGALTSGVYAVWAARVLDPQRRRLAEQIAQE